MRLLFDPLAGELGAVGGVSPAPAATTVSDDIQPGDGGAPIGDRPDFNAPNASEPGSAGVGGAPLAPADPNQRAGAAAPATTNQWTSIREAAQAQGFQFGADITDDRQALNFLLQRAAASRQENVHAQLGRQLAPRANEILGFLQGQRPAAAPATPERPAWEAPEFDERWAALVDRDPATGMFIGKPGAPAWVADKVNAYVEWKTKFDRNPGVVLNGMVEERARAIAKETFQSQFAEQQQATVIQQITNENSQWLYQRDASGNPVRTFEGGLVPTPVGARYVHHLRSVVSMGVTDPRQQDALAKQLVRGEFALASQQAAVGQQTAAANPQTVAAQARPNVNPLGALPPSQRSRNPQAVETEQVGLSLAERMRADLAAEGVTDADVFASSGG